MNLDKYFLFIIIFCMSYENFCMALYPSNYAKIKIRYYDEMSLSHNELTNLEFLLNDENITLNLTKVSLIGSKTPVWLLKKNYYDLPIEETNPFTLGNAVQFYEDEDKNSTMAVVTDNYGQKEIMGIFGPWFISPLRGIRSYDRKSRSINQTEAFLSGINSSDSVFITDYHMISQISNFELANNIIISPSAPHDNSNAYNRREHIHKREAGYATGESTVYPGVLIIADYNIKFSSPTESRFYNFLIYIIVFWNSVDLRFRGLQDPRIRLRISGIIVAKSHKAIPFFQSNVDGNTLKVGRAKEEMGDWLLQNKRIFPIESYNIAIAMTNLPLCLSSASGRCGSTEVTGMAKGIGTICTPEWALTVYPTAVVNDFLDFSGIVRATHEIGHLLGADHDGSKHNEDCDESSNNVMAPTDKYTPSKHIWSKCSQRSISKFLKSRGADCLHDIMPIKDVGDSIMQAISLLDQCHLIGFTNACDAIPETCTNLQCRNTGWAGVRTLWQCTDVGPALEGSPCGIGFCRNNSCVPSINPILGDFGNGIL